MAGKIKYEPYRKSIEDLAEHNSFSETVRKFQKKFGFGTTGGLRNYMDRNGIISYMQPAWEKMTQEERDNFSKRWNKTIKRFKEIKK